MNYIVIDLEWNQASNAKNTVLSPVKLTGEIIQIGAIKCDDQKRVISTFNCLVKPVFYKELHFKVKSLTNISASELEKAKTFPEAIKDFIEWCGDNYIFLTWGYDDIPVLRDNLKIHLLDESWIQKNYNLQIIFNNQTDKLRRQRSLKAAAEQLGINFSLREHDAFNDAYYTCEISKRLDLENGIAEYVCARNENQARKQFNPFEYEISNVRHDGFDSKSSASKYVDESLRPCPQCSSQMKILNSCSRKPDKKFYFALCDTHGRFLIKLKFSKAKDGTYSVLKTVYKYDTKLRNHFKLNKRRKTDKNKADTN